MKRWIDRVARVPLYLPVVTEPHLASCWAVNLSRSGIGLVASRHPSDELPVEGAHLGLDFALPDGSRVAAGAEVMWSGDSGGTFDGHIAVAVGLRFSELEGDARMKLERYFQSYRPHVVVAGVPERHRSLVGDALDGRADLHIAASADDLRALVLRGDVSAVVIGGESEGEVLEMIDAVGAEGGFGSILDVSPANDLAPRVVLLSNIDSIRLVELFNRGQVFSVVDRALDRAALQAAVMRACGDHGVRTEQHRASIALERALLRERARGRTPDGLSDLVADRMVVVSPQMRAVVERAERAAPHRVGVLLQGETGTGKEVLAGLIHELSERAHAPFVAQDCGALTETLLESELFGHVRGAFTGAVDAHPGLFVMADGGTILLDEIENTSANLQAKLLRVIETGEVRPVGGTKVRKVDVRIIAASNRDLAAAMNAGKFRPDLFFRLMAFPIDIPPLRARRDDIMPLAAHFLARAGAGDRVFSRLAKRELLAHDWPGNARELRNVVERAVLLAAPERPLEVELLRFTAEPAAGPSGGSLKERLAAVEREIIRDALARNGGVLRRAAMELSTNSVTLGRRARRYGLLDGP